MTTDQSARYPIPDTRLSTLDYELPVDRIATQAAEPRDAARLMVVHRDSGGVEHRHVRDLADIVARDDMPAPSPGDLMIFNQTRVLPAQFEAVRAATGGKITGLYLRHAPPNQWQVMLESRGTLREGEKVELDADSHLILTQRLDGGQWRATLQSPTHTLELLERIGETPLPPYIRSQRRNRNQREVGDDDATRYNTVYARAPGSVAAPTAGLHFTPELLRRLDEAGIVRATLTLHVGLGTFAPIRTDRLDEHVMHSEWLHIPASTLRAIAATRDAGGRLIPVGTTSVRALESLPRDWRALMESGFETSTDLFITPGFTFRFAEALLTNFHLPRSTLLALVGALCTGKHGGIDQLKRWYAIAVEEGYRFYSYGDAMLIV